MRAIALCLLLALLPAVCAAGESQAEANDAEGRKMKVQIGEFSFEAALEENEAAAELEALLREGPLRVELDDYSGFEKVGALGATLTAEDEWITTVPGDIVLYRSSDVVLFYGSNSWNYTRLGHIEDLTDWEAALGDGSITAEFRLED